MHDAEAALRPARELHLAKLSRSFTLRCSDGFVETFGPALIARVASEAPGVHVRFMAKQDKDALYVIAAAYDNVDAAVSDYEAVTQVKETATAPGQRRPWPPSPSLLCCLPGPGC